MCVVFNWHSMSVIFFRLAFDRGWLTPIASACSLFDMQYEILSLYLTCHAISCHERCWSILKWHYVTLIGSDTQWHYVLFYLTLCSGTCELTCHYKKCSLWCIYAKSLFVVDFIRIFFIAMFVEFLYLFSTYTCTGIAANTLLAKICSDKNKPNGQYMLPFNIEAVQEFMRDLPVRKVRWSQTCKLIFWTRFYV